MKIAIRKSDRRIKYLSRILQKPYPFTKQNVLSVIEDKNLFNRKLYLELFDLIETKGISLNNFDQLKTWATYNWPTRKSRLKRLIHNFKKTYNVRTK